jgi:aspartate aminotransferase-like enzyme
MIGGSSKQSSNSQQNGTLSRTSKKVALIVGSGTIGNDMVAATLAVDHHRANGLVLVNGEFGERLLKQANRYFLAPQSLKWDWGQTWNFEEIESKLKLMPKGGWIWCVHHETSTGILNDYQKLVQLAHAYGQRVCMDCVSSLGTVPVNLSGVYLATGASGKAIGSYAGIAFVFADPNELSHIDPESVPTYFDLLSTLNTVGPRFTVPSPLIRALDVALEQFADEPKRIRRFAEIASQMSTIRQALIRNGLKPLASETVSSPAMVTFAPPDGKSAKEFVCSLMEHGFQIAGQSGYLAERGLVQVAVMGALSNEQIDRFVSHLDRTLKKESKTIAEPSRFTANLQNLQISLHNPSFAAETNTTQTTLFGM